MLEGVVSIARMEEESLRAVPIRSPSPEAYPCEEGCFSCLKRFVKNKYESCFQFQAQYRKLIFALIGGQILSLFLCGTGTTSEALEQFYSITAPTTQLFFTYLFLALVYGPIVVCKKDFHEILKRNWWKYVLIGIIDVEANYFVVLAYKYTNVSSVQILDSFTLFTVLVLSYVFLRTRYLIIHLMGVALALIGIFSLVLVDFNSPVNEAGPRPLIGDLLCLVGSVLYAVSNVCQEYFVKNHSIFEWLGFLGTVGAVVSGIQLSVLENMNLAAATWNLVSCGYFALFVLCLFLFYSITPIVMKYSNAVVVNLSLLTADVYTIIVGVYLFKQSFSFLYIVSFVIVVFGVFIFNIKPLPPAPPRIMLKEIKSRLLRQRRKKPKEDSNLLGEAKNSAKREKLSPDRGESPIRESDSYGSYSTEGSNILRKMSSKEGSGSVGRQSTPDHS